MLIDKDKRNAYAVVIFVCLLVFEVFSFASSYQAVYDLVGIADWAILLGAAFVLVDFAGMGKLFSGAPTEGDNQFLAGAWVLSAIGDSLLTFLSVHLQISKMPAGVMVTTGTISLNFMQIWVPAFIAVLVWGTQFFLVKSLNTIIDNLVKGRVA